MRNHKNLEHTSKVIKYASFNRVHEKKLFTRELVLKSIKLEMSCTVTYYKEMINHAFISGVINYLQPF